MIVQARRLFWQRDLTRDRVVCPERGPEARSHGLEELAPERVMPQRSIYVDDFSGSILEHIDGFWLACAISEAYARVCGM